MADPLSIAASIVGLMSAAAKIAELLAPIASSLKDPARLAGPVRSEILNVRAILGTFQTLLGNLASIRPGRAVMVQIDHLVTAFMYGVFIFSELESTVVGLGPAPGQGDSESSSGSVRVRIQWARKERDLQMLLGRLQSFKGSLMCLLSIFQCVSDIEAAKSQQELSAWVSELIESNDDLSRRLNKLEDHFDAQSVISFPIHRKPRRLDCTISAYEESPQVLASISESFVVRHEYEGELQSSRVYRRAQQETCDVSFRSSIARTTAWSIFSGVSLSDISVISVIALPVYAKDVSNSEHYDFSVPRINAASNEIDPEVQHWTLQFSSRHRNIGAHSTQLEETIGHFKQEFPDIRTNFITRRVLSKASEKLGRLSVQQLSELVSDVLDELDRRKKMDQGWYNVPSRLLVDDSFHPKRNEARGKMAIIRPGRMMDLATDVYIELSRRHGVVLQEISEE